MNKIKNIRHEMAKRGIDLWVARVVDVHNSENICEHDNVLRWACGFTGESAALVITDSEARLWVDGRFFISAAQEIQDSEVILMKYGLPDVPSSEQWIEDWKNCFREVHEGRECIISRDPELIAPLWPDRPGRPSEPIWGHAGKDGFDETGCSEYEDRSTAEKLKIIRQGLKERGADAVFAKTLDNVIWISNLRGSDIECTPVFFSFMYISMDNAVIFLQKKALKDEAADYLERSGISVIEYELFGEFEKEFGEESSMNSVITSENFITELKSLKTPAEIRHMKECHLRDGVYVTRFIYEMKKVFRQKTEKSENLQSSENQYPRFEDEMSASKTIDGLRGSDERFLSPSFPTISAYGDNAAIVHYAVNEKSNRKLENRGFYLVDSGGQYLDGTTDITRTIALGELTEEEKKHYTLVMCGMLRLMNAQFDEGTNAYDLDKICRQPLYDHGLDFRHGTGHGVGYCGCVHEAPVRISNSPKCAEFFLKPGMITSDEPGIYIEGSHGIRIENLLVCEKAEDSADKSLEGRLHFTCLTMAPLDPDAVDIKYMSDEDVTAYNEYQSKVYVMISPRLTDDEAQWLRHETTPISRK